MAETHIHIAARPEDVFSVLANAQSFAEWVVGAKTIRGQDGNWPEPGSLFHHTIGVGPLKLRDVSKVLECEPPKRLVLEAVARPIGSATVVLEVVPEGGGSRVRMSEKPRKGPVAFLPSFLLDPFTRARNQKSLQRLRDAVERGESGS